MTFLKSLSWNLLKHLAFPSSEHFPVKPTEPSKNIKESLPMDNVLENELFGNESKAEVICYFKYVEGRTIPGNNQMLSQLPLPSLPQLMKRNFSSAPGLWVPGALLQKTG